MVGIFIDEQIDFLEQKIRFWQITLRNEVALAEGIAIVNLSDDNIVRDQKTAIIKMKAQMIRLQHKLETGQYYGD